MFTVCAYVLIYGVSYSAKTYMSLLPLTFGVMLACSFDVSASNFLGLLCAFGSAIVFVTSNIFFKKIMPTSSAATTGHKLDKLNLLFYSSGLAFLVMIPMWLFYDFGPLWMLWSAGENLTRQGDYSHSVLYYFFLNGTVHWAQNIIAFAILSSTSPVTYSIASLVKRIVVIVMAIVWFRQAIHPVQGVGITMTFLGLWMYNNAKGDVEKGEHKMRRVEAARDLALPTSLDQFATLSPKDMPPGLVHSQSQPAPQPSNRASRNRSMSMHQHGHSHANGHVPPPLLPPMAATHPTKPRITIVSPIIESYPSPPLSFDSPPPTLAPSPLELHSAGTLARRLPGGSSTPEPLLAQQQALAAQ